MTWNNDHLAPVETLLFQSDLVKVGSFECDVDDPCFPVSKSLDNDVFVLPKNPVWIRRNAGEFHFVEPGAILMHRAGSMLERRGASARGECTYWFGVHPQLFVEALRRHNLSTRQMGGALIVEPQLRYRIALLLRELDVDRRDKLAIEEEVLMLFLEICERRAAQDPRRSRLNGDTSARQRQLVDKARAYLDEHLAESVSLQSVANEIGASLFHLCRVFRAQTGLTMHAYRTRQRLGHVLDRLVNGKFETLAELALDTGFASHSHLSRVFQKQMGMPPSAVRG